MISPQLQKRAEIVTAPSGSLQPMTCCFWTSSLLVTRYSNTWPRALAVRGGAPGPTARDPWWRQPADGPVAWSGRRQSLWVEPLSLGIGPFRTASLKVRTSIAPDLHEALLHTLLTQGHSS